MISLYPDQEEFLTEVRKLWKQHLRMIGCCPTGFGKCLGIDTPILMFDGSIKKVQDVSRDDLLMGPDSSPRKVLSTVAGNEELFKITPLKGDSVIVNKSHILSLKLSNVSHGTRAGDGNIYNGGDIVNISVSDYLRSSKTFKHIAKWWRTGVDFINRDKLEIPPYILGVWLGDGTTKAPSITTADEYIENLFYEYAESLGCYIRSETRDGSCNTLNITRGRTGKTNPFLDLLRSVGVLGDKHIPEKYKTSSRADRMEVLAGVIDTDGYLAKGTCFDIVLKQKKFAADVCFVARSLGLAAYMKECRKGIKSTGFIGTYYRICISGDTHLIPTRLRHKQASDRRQVKNVLVAGFKIESIGDGNYYGFEIAGNDKLFLLGDFTVTHNTRCAARIIEGCVSKGMKVCFIVPRISLIEQTAKAFVELGLEDITYLWADYPTDHNAKITIASVDTYIRRKKMDFDLVIVDEVQHKRKVLLEWMDSHPEDRYLGLTATPFAPWLGTFYTAMAKSKPMWWLIKNKRLSDYDVYAPSHPNLKGLKTQNTSLGRDYKESDIAEIMGESKLVGDVVQNWLQNGENRLTMALCVNTDHAGYLTNEFNHHGIKAELITHHVPIEERLQIFQRARDGITRIILSIDCLTEGFDMPEVSCLINARPTKSKTRFVQGIGRVLRYVKGKHAIIFDHAASFIDPELGFVEYIEADDLWSDSDGLDEASKVRKEKEKKEKLPKECKQCHFLKPPGVLVCEKCGHKPIAGENIDIDETRELSSIKKVKPKKEDKQRFYSELLHYQQTRKMNGKPISDGAIAHIYKSKMGVWPRSLHSAIKSASPETLNYIKSRQIAYSKRMNKA